MSFRFWRRLKVAQGLHVNLSRSGASLSLGPEGATGTVGPGGARASFGIPGSGLFYTLTPRKGRTPKRTTRVGSSGGEASGPPPRPDLGFLGRVTASPARRALATGIVAWQDGDETTALAAFEDAGRARTEPSVQVDGAWFAGLLRLARHEVDDAHAWFKVAQQHVDQLGSACDALGVTPVFALEVSDQASVALPPHPISLQLALAEVQQRLGQFEEARVLLEPLLHEKGLDSLVVLSAWCDLILNGPHTQEDLKKLVERTAGLENDSVLHAILLLYKGQALLELGLLHAARETLTAGYRKRADRPEDLRRTLRFVRAEVYEALGQTTRARSEREAIYAEDPSYPGLAELLGMA